ncbi:hypothetical protein [Aurantimonas marina]|uniref:hypothetical protein n=1 Tax=Aurantimonas marina TaxID=2780508 RepID=UPI0019D2987F|nr:hypothetical protein [Aurantimonas marina]
MRDKAVPISNEIIAYRWNGAPEEAIPNSDLTDFPGFVDCLHGSIRDRKRGNSGHFHDGDRVRLRRLPPEIDDVSVQFFSPPNRSMLFDARRSVNQTHPGANVSAGIGLTDGGH